GDAAGNLLHVDGDWLVTADRLEIEQDQQVNAGHRGWNEGVRLEGVTISGNTGIGNGLLFWIALGGGHFLSVAELGPVKAGDRLEEEEFARFFGLVLRVEGRIGLGQFLRSETILGITETGGSQQTGG